MTAMSETSPADAIPFPALLRWARAVYGGAIRAALAAAGRDDIPRNGIYVLAAISRSAVPLGQIVKELGASKQAAGQLVDTLVLRGYLERGVDPDDRRRLTVTLSERGRAAAAVSKAAVDRIDADLATRVGPEQIAAARTVLLALVVPAPAQMTDPTQ